MERLLRIHVLGYFTHDQKGLCHYYIPATAQEKRRAQKLIDKMELELKPILRSEWELQNKMQRMGLYNLRGMIPQWKCLLNGNDYKEGNDERYGEFSR